ncbi:TOMM precursor leader peptide-binding protein [Trinickia terrae]|uniref:TOMM leader peptide-binding protein n=1 Tax=Trinickia terrae TaxID=2571161 RepID=A0A4V5PI50_9BURK|nr:TOMM precursor leader peptide-binding protein [Trinickia terrae]TKC86000.1 TOMM precursor leader peptide-binding protein [Trinickia terrae]
MLDDFSRVLRFKPHLQVLDAGPDALFIVDEFKRAVLRGAVYVRVAACLRDRLTIGQTIDALAAGFSAWQVLAALDHLVRRAYVRSDMPDAALDAARGFFERAGLDGDAACERLRQLSVAVEAFGVDASAQKRAFAACGIDVVPEAAFTVALVDSYARRELDELAERVSARGGALLLVMPGGVQPLIGPLLTFTDAAHDAPCIDCVRYWTSLNRPVEMLLARRHGDAAMRPAAAHTRAGMGAVSAFVAALAEQLAVDDARREAARRQILSWRLDTSITAPHRVARRPQCPRCGNPRWMREQAGRPPSLAAGVTFASREGGFRASNAQEVMQRYGHLVSPVSGPIAYLHPMPKRHAGLRKVYVAGYLVSPPGMPCTNRFDRICSGKGRTDEQARVSALCETLERFSGVYQGDEASVRASMNALRTSDAHGGGVPLHVNDLQQFSEQQFERRDVINALTDDARKQVPQRFCADDVIDWTPAWSLNTGTRRWLPLGYCFAETPDSTDGLRFCVHNPNGSAAGSCLEEAILQGLLELIERDATAIWWYNQAPRPGIDLASFRDAWFDALLAEYASLGWRLWALDITHDLGIPVVAALAEHPASGRFSIGFGCHLDSHIAVQRALTEVNQLLDVTADAPPPWDASKLSSSAFLYPAPALPAVDPSTRPGLDARDLKDAIEQCMGRLSSSGMEVLVVDKTRPDIGLPVVQAVVPGLCHFWPRFGAPRLYSVPVEQGWLDRPRREDELNGALLFL